MTSEFILDCPVCGNKDTSNLESIDVAKQHHHYAPQSQKRQQELTEAAKPSALNYQMILCNNCQLEFASPTIAPGPAWYDLAYQTLHLYPHDRWEFQFVVQKLVTAKGNLLELGCGSGEFLKICKASNIPAMGLDFSPEAVNQCHKAGLDVQVFDLTKESNNVNKDIKTITAFHVLEHLDEPIRIFDFASKVATKDTVLWIAVPSHVRPSRTFGMTDFLDQPPHHMTRWNKKSLKEIGSRANWSLNKIYYEPISINASCWWITTRKLWVYKFLNPTFVKKPKLERIFRTILFPFAFISRQLFFKRMQGFTMLASYRFSGQ
jgi:SAM-dependent methyltransferase